MKPIQDKRKSVSKISEYETVEGRNYLTYLYRDLGLSDNEVAKKIGVSRMTLYNWRKKSKVIDNAIQVGKNTMDTQVENVLLQSALKGNVTAMIFWLKNRKPAKWRERQDVNLDAEVLNKTDIEKYKKYITKEMKNDKS